ncbi:thermonuclease family protein [Brachyspira sp.]|uniref:thermonuclease family protein n=1 Tax=Brachyspira sp. TaxID=1977261 RepID=UPI003D7C558E
MKNILQIIIILFLIQTTLITANYKDEIKDFTIVKVRDGDTFVINIENVPDVFGRNIAVRIRGIDTPELNDKREEIRNIAIKAKEELEKLFNSGNKIILYNLGRDKYFRLLASVKVDDGNMPAGAIDVAEYLIKKGLAKSYDGGAKVW